VKPPEFCRAMEEGTDVPYFDGRDSQLLLELTPERVLDALPKLDVTAWKGDRAWYHPLRRLPLLREHRRLLKDEGRYAFKRASVFPSPKSLAAERHAAEPLAVNSSFLAQSRRRLNRRVSQAPGRSVCHEIGTSKGYHRRKTTGLSVAVQQIANHQLTKIIQPVVDKDNVKACGSTQRDGIEPRRHWISKANVIPRIYVWFGRSTEEFLHFAL
jgi:hypothetical protein